MKKIVATAVILASACGVFGGREILAEDTTRHEVRKGDTLWDLSDGYLDDPLLWPKIWKFNPKIANPHRIFPGQSVKIPGIVKTAIRATPAPSGVAPAAPESSALARAGQASFSDPLPVVVVKKELLPAGEPAPAIPESLPARHYERGIGMVTGDIPGEGLVLHTAQGWQSAAFGETVLISAPGARVGQQFGVYRDLGKVEALRYFDISPGHLLADVAVIEIVASAGARQQAVVRRAFAEMRSGDLLGQVPEQPVVVAARPCRPGADSVRGAVLAFPAGHQFAGPDDILYLNIGAAQGLAPGDLLSVAGPEQAGDRTSGEIMILRVAADTAAAVVTSRSSHEVRRGDVVGPPVL